MSDESGASRLEPDRWLAGLFGHPVFRLNDEAGPLSDLTDHLPRGDSFLFARVPAGDVAKLGQLASAGFRVVDVTLRFTRSPGEAQSTMRPGLYVRDARPGDFGRILAIAGSAFRYSRFHLDPLVPRSIADSVKRAWMDSYRTGQRGAGCLVAIESAGDMNEGHVVGFLGVIEMNRDGIVRGIDLIGVDESAQSRGVGRALVEAFTSKAAGHARELEVGTQAANVRSVRLYESCGFRLANAAYVMHAHFRDGSPR